MNTASTGKNVQIRSVAPNRQGLDTRTTIRVYVHLNPASLSQSEYKFRTYTDNDIASARVAVLVPHETAQFQNFHKLIRIYHCHVNTWVNTENLKWIDDFCCLQQSCACQFLLAPKSNTLQVGTQGVSKTLIFSALYFSLRLILVNQEFLISLEQMLTDEIL